MNLSSLLDFSSANCLNISQLQKLLCQLLRGVAHFHSIGAAHGALNTKNVLIDIGNENLKILNIAMVIIEDSKPQLVFLIKLLLCALLLLLLFVLTACIYVYGLLRSTGRRCIIHST